MVKKTIKSMIQRSKAIKLGKKHKKLINKKTILSILLVIILGTILIGGYITYDYFTEKTFFKDYDSLNNNFKQALFSTGNNHDIALDKVTIYNSNIIKFFHRYKTYKPDQFNRDSFFMDDMDKILGLSNKALSLTQNSEFEHAHLTLEEVRDVWQQIFIRNKIISLNYLMVDFHDLMELAEVKALDKDVDGVLYYCPILKERWSEMFKVETKLVGDKLINFYDLLKQEDKNINDLCIAAETHNLEDLPELGVRLKQGFIKPYLTYG